MVLPPGNLEKEEWVTLKTADAALSAGRPSFEVRFSHTQTGDRTCLDRISPTSITVARQCRSFAGLRWIEYCTSFH